MVKYAIADVQDGTFEYLVMFGYDGGKWCIKYASGELFRPVTLNDPHAAYNLINLLNSLHPIHRGILVVDEIEIDD